MMKSKTLAQLAGLAGAEPIGDPDLAVEGVQSVNEVGKDEVTLALDRRYLTRAHQTPAAAIIIPPALRSETLPERAYLVAENPKLAFALVLEYFGEPVWRPEGVSLGASIDESAHLGSEVAVGPQVFIGAEASIGDETTLYPGVYVGRKAVLGSRCTLYPGAVVMDRCELGNDVILHSGVVIGADGFGTVFDGERHRKIPQIGRVVIGNDVEIGATTCVDRATVGVTHIGDNTKIDNQVQIGHNGRIGEQVLISGRVGLSGSVSVGRRAVLAGESAAADHAEIGDEAVLMARAVAVGKIESGRQVLGFPARDHRQEMRIQALTGKLPELFKRLRELERKVEESEKASP